MDRCPDGSDERLLSSRIQCNLSDSRQAETTVKLGILELFARLFGWMWVGAAIASVYFLYVALASAAPWSNLFWSIGAGLIAYFLAAVLNRNKQRVDYVDQLMKRGYMPADAEFAWYIATNGGANLLHDLQRVELDDEIDRLKSAIGTSGTENPGE